MKKISLFIFAASMLCAAIVTSCWEVILPEEPVVLVGKQEGTLTAGAPGLVTFPVITADIAGGTYTATVTNLPEGVTVSGQVTISTTDLTIGEGDETTIAGVGTLTLAGDSTILAGTISTLRLTIDDTQSEPFTLTISPSTYVAVTDITNVPTTATAGTPLTLTATVIPENATNKTITWSVQNAGNTGATISGNNNNTLNTTGAGTAVVRATIVNGASPTTSYTKDFTITVNAAFVAVTDITGVPTTATAGTALTLSGTVVPTNATNKTITWSVQNAGNTGAAISNGNTLNTTGAGTVVVRATIVNGASPTTNYTKDFTITISAAFVAVSNITGVPTAITAGTPLTLTGTVVPSDATNKTITWSVQNAGNTGASINGNTLNATGAGTVIVRATIVNGASPTANYTQDFSITSTELVKTVSVGTQSGTLVEYTVGSVTFAVSTSNIATSQAGTVTWYSNAAGTTATSAPDNITTSVSTGNATRTLTVQSVQAPTHTGTVPGTYYFRVTVDGVQSNVGTLTVAARTVTIGAQSGTVTSISGGTATYSVTTNHIATSETGDVAWYADAAGTQYLSSPPQLVKVQNITVSTGNATRTLTMVIGPAGLSANAAGTYYFRVVVGGIQSSNVGNLVIGN